MWGMNYGPYAYIIIGTYFSMSLVWPENADIWHQRSKEETVNYPIARTLYKNLHCKSFYILRLYNKGCVMEKKRQKRLETATV